MSNATAHTTWCVQHDDLDDTCGGSVRGGHDSDGETVSAFNATTICGDFVVVEVGYDAGDNIRLELTERQAHELLGHLAGALGERVAGVRL
jgi:hypothetical protein